VGGKLIWRCLETNSHTVAKATMSRWGRPRGLQRSGALQTEQGAPASVQARSAT